jgi:hypothetical protein
VLDSVLPSCARIAATANQQILEVPVRTDVLTRWLPSSDRVSPTWPE